ncbi:hypothetical protein GGX14DRAFT_349458 [Mycena pura]|uniref:Uncharacterized protein n=1 Tax=Mycena pura TaxID=153505 RepID=A0AAD6YQ83_9AGAR|nr:hypothetical protein GGX14DRAFT_349458 [Mycena pura]
MPPPAPPAPKILIPQVEALRTTLKNVAVKTGEIYAFYADTRKLGIRNLAPAPPQSLTATLGREAEKYDQLCDALESKLLRAISVLQRDLVREERRIAEAEAASTAKAHTIAGRTRSASSSPTTTRIPLPAIDLLTANADSSPLSSTDPAQSPLLSGSSISGRRPSAISISSLHRPNLPLKLDLSSTTLRISPEEASLFSHGLSSPVTLAPRSARPYGPNELPPDLMAALASASSTTESASQRVDIDLTSEQADPDVNMAAIGNSADKPIELDLDAMEIDMATMSDLFGDAESGSNADGGSVEGLFTPVMPGPDMPLAVAHALGGTKIKDEDQEDSFLNALSDAGDEDIFASLQADAHGHGDAQTGTAGSSTPAPLSDSLLASFSQMGDAPAANHANLSGEGAPTYDLDSLDLSIFGDNQNADMNFDMEELLNMDGSVRTP